MRELLFGMTEQQDRELYSGRILSLWVKYVPQPDGRRHMREIVEHKPGAAAVAVDAEGKVLLVRQPRPAVGRDMLELPAGLIDADEAPIDCARRELEEETGVLAGRLEPLVAFYTSPGFTDELVHVFAAFDLRATTARHDEEEQIELVRLPLAEAIAQVLRGEISDAKTVTGLLAYERLTRRA